VIEWTQTYTSSAFLLYKIIIAAAVSGLNLSIFKKLTNLGDFARPPIPSGRFFMGERRPAESIKFILTIWLNHPFPTTTMADQQMADDQADMILEIPLNFERDRVREGSAPLSLTSQRHQCYQSWSWNGLCCGYQCACGLDLSEAGINRFIL